MLPATQLFGGEIKFNSPHAKTHPLLPISRKEGYKQLASEVQHSKETPQSLLMQVFDLRQKVLFASHESESGLKYNPALVQYCICAYTLCLLVFRMTVLALTCSPFC